MNEKFLSRGKLKDNGEWVTGYYVKLPEHHIIKEQIQCLSTD